MVTVVYAAAGARQRWEDIMAEVTLPPVSSATASPIQDDNSLQKLRAETERAAEAPPTSGAAADCGNGGESGKGEGEGREEGSRRRGEEEGDKGSSELSGERVSQLSQFLRKQQEVVYR